MVCYSKFSKFIQDKDFRNNMDLLGVLAIAMISIFIISCSFETFSWLTTAFFIMGFVGLLLLQILYETLLEIKDSINKKEQ